MYQPVYDLFGEIPVYHQDVTAWLVSVPRMDPTSWRAAWYVRGYDVVNKIRRAKLEGRFAETVSHPQPERRVIQIVGRSVPWTRSVPFGF